MKGKKLRYSDLPIEFLVKDMVGLGALERYEFSNCVLVFIYPTGSTPHQDHL